MKTRKVLAVLLALVLTVVPLAVTSFAANADSAAEIVSSAVKTSYYDSEYFNPIGIVVNDGKKDVTYTPGNADFRFDPALNELLTVETTEVRVFYKNVCIGTVEVTVSHILGELTAFDGGHGHYCLGCGMLCEFEEHNIDNWVPNDDGGVFTCQTQTGICTVCGASVTESIPNTEKFKDLFDLESMTDFEVELFEYFYLIVVSLVQMLVGIS